MLGDTKNNREANRSRSGFCGQFRAELLATILGVILGLMAGGMIDNRVEKASASAAPQSQFGPIAQAAHTAPSQARQ